jgi:hypothetical protein
MGERGNGGWGMGERETGGTGELGNYELLLIRNINHMYGGKRTEKGNRNSTG